MPDARLQRTRDAYQPTFLRAGDHVGVYDPALDTYTCLCDAEWMGDGEPFHPLANWSRCDFVMTNQHIIESYPFKWATPLIVHAD